MMPETQLCVSSSPSKGEGKVLFSASLLYLYCKTLIWRLVSNRSFHPFSFATTQRTLRTGSVLKKNTPDHIADSLTLISWLVPFQNTLEMVMLLDSKSLEGWQSCMSATKGSTTALHIQDNKPGHASTPCWEKNTVSGQPSLQCQHSYPQLISTSTIDK